MNKTFAAIATLVGAVIGAGILGIPFVVSKSGFGIGLLTILLVGTLVMIVTLYLGEIGLRTKSNHHLAGYAEKYLGKKGKILMFLAFAFGVYSALIAYLIGEGESLSHIFFNSSQYSLHFGIAFWLVLSVIVYFGLSALEKGESIGIIAILILIVSIVLFFGKEINPTNLAHNNLALFFAPFGVILFAFLGFNALPEMERILKKHKRKTKRTIILSYAVIALIYIIFTLVVVGINGVSTPEIATLSLGKIFILLGMITMLTSYLALSAALIDSLRFDFKIKKTKAWLITISLPLIFYIILNSIKQAAFSKILGVGGIISGGLVAILILIMAKNAKKIGERKPEYSIPYSKILIFFIILILAIGVILEIMNFL